MERIRAQGETSLAPADVVIFTCDSTEIYIYIYIYVIKRHFGKLMDDQWVERR